MAIKKNIKKKTVKPAIKSKEKPIGKIIHFFSHISVAVIKLSSPLSVGDKIRVKGGENTDFEQSVASMEMDHEKLKKAKAGMEVGIKLKEKAREDYKVFKI